jgi:hypothetical protein
MARNKFKFTRSEVHRALRAFAEASGLSLCDLSLSVRRDGTITVMARDSDKSPNHPQAREPRLEAEKEIVL